MTTGQLAIVLVRLAAIWIVVTTIQYAGSTIQYYEGTNNVVVVVTHLFPLMIAAFMWLFPAHVAKSVASQNSSEIGESKGAAAKFLSLGIAFLGLYLLVYAILDSIFYVLLAIWEQGELGVNANDTRANLIVSVIQIAVGIAFIVGRRGFVRLFYRFRYREDADV